MKATAPFNFSRVPREDETSENACSSNHSSGYGAGLTFGKRPTNAADDGDDEEQDFLAELQPTPVRTAAPVSTPSSGAVPAFDQSRYSIPPPSAAVPMPVVSGAADITSRPTAVAAAASAPARSSMSSPAPVAAGAGVYQDSAVGGADFMDTIDDFMEELSSQWHAQAAAPDHTLDDGPTHIVVGEPHSGRSSNNSPSLRRTKGGHSQQFEGEDASSETWTRSSIPHMPPAPPPLQNRRPIIVPDVMPTALAPLHKKQSTCVML